jgi:serine-type D-Ala-D-Ala carboxypeptidase/endopeptidase (penicillin-binding protein 4)
MVVEMRRLTLSCAVFATLACPAGASALGTEGLRAKLSREIRPAGTGAGAHVVDLDTGRVLFSRRPDVARPPASVNKLFVTATALLRFGPAATLDTEVLASEPPSADGEVTGNLWLRGGGDPTLTDRDMRDLTDQLAAAGVARVEGGVAGDGTVFDQLPGSYRTGGRFDFDMGGGITGLGLDRGLKRGRWQRTPALFAARGLARELRREGIRVPGRTRVDAAPDGVTALASVSSPTMRTLVRVTNRPSDNLYAEALLKALGARFGRAGSTAGGAAVVRARLARLGIHPRIADGSGLARSNRTTPRQVVRLLERMHGQQVGATFRASLARPGRAGTLRRRMRRTAAERRCAGKTGTLRAVSALAGYCETADGHTVAFAFLMSGVYVPGARRIQDRMTSALAALTAGT